MHRIYQCLGLLACAALAACSSGYTALPSSTSAYAKSAGSTSLAEQASAKPTLYVLTPSSVIIYAPPYSVSRSLLRPVQGGFAVGQNVFIEGKGVINEYSGSNLSHLATITVSPPKKSQPSHHFVVAPNGTLIVGLTNGLLVYSSPYGKPPRNIGTSNTGNGPFQPKNLTMGTNGRFFFTGVGVARPCALYAMDPPYTKIKALLDRTCDPTPPLHKYFAIDPTNANQYAGVKAYAPSYTGAPDWRGNGFPVSVYNPDRLVANAGVAAFEGGDNGPWYVFQPPAAAPLAVLAAPHIANNGDWPIAIGANRNIYAWDPTEETIDVYAQPYSSAGAKIGSGLTNVSGLFTR
jgi:hypothetical protein